MFDSKRKCYSALIGTNFWYDVTVNIPTHELAIIENLLEINHIHDTKMFKNIIITVSHKYTVYFQIK